MKQLMKRQYFFYATLMVLLPSLLVGCGQVLVIEPGPGQPAPVEVVAPLTQAQPSSIEAEATTGSAFYAANPELMIVHRRLATAREESLDSSFLAANPELMVARRYATMVKLREKGD